MALVLIVEDDPDMAYLAVGWLRRIGHRTVVASDGSTGLALLRSQARVVALVILDLTLPGLHGTEFLRQMKSDSATARIPALVVSAQRLPDPDSWTGSYAPDGYLSKPYVMSDLNSAVESLIGSPDS